jgi:hypothetical protein
MCIQKERPMPEPVYNFYEIDTEIDIDPQEELYYQNPILEEPLVFNLNTPDGIYYYVTNYVELIANSELEEEEIVHAINAVREYCPNYYIGQLYCEPNNHLCCQNYQENFIGYNPVFCLCVGDTDQESD